VNDGHPLRIFSVPPTGGPVRQILNPSDYLSQYSVDEAADFLACTRENNTTPPNVAAVDMTTGEVRTLVNVNPEFQYLQLGSVRRIDVTNKYGDKFFANLVLPFNYQPGKRYPLIFTTYHSGASFLRGGVGDEYPIQVFAANGFAILDFDSGSDRSLTPGDFETAILRWQSPIEGMQAAVAKLNDMQLIDPTKVGITGLSHGAELVAYAISHSQLFKAAIASGPVGYGPYFFYMANTFWHEYSAHLGLGGWPEGAASANWHRISPTLNADRINAPLLVNAADTEYVAGLDLIVSLEELRKPVEMFIYPNELHVKNQVKHRYEIYERNLDWFKFWLKSEEDRDATKAEQYARWHKLKKIRNSSCRN
jgi:dipeptidyl aminopeptidase/acylaminoacyl peptidase